MRRPWDIASHSNSQSPTNLGEVKNLHLENRACIVI